MTTIEALRGRINDADSHEMIPVKLWPEAFGDVGHMTSTFMQDPVMAASVSDFMSDLFVDVDIDDIEIGNETVWQHRGWERQGARAPGGFDMHRRLEVLDFMGVRRQQVFPSFGLFGMVLSTAAPGYIANLVGAAAAEAIGSDQIKTLGRAMIRAYNDWAMMQVKVDEDRLRLVAVIDTSDLSELMAETERVLAGGVRSLYIPASVPPDGKSPADRAIAPFWALCEEANATVQLHLAVEHFMQTDVWGHVPEFQIGTLRSLEFTVDPWTLATVHMPVDNYLTTMILGGVFERHPRLRFGAIECGASWVGPLAERLDMWAEVATRQKQLNGVLSMAPSEYLSRNVRVTPFWFEPIAMYFERYGIEDVLCYGSDYPHPEGGKDQMEILATKLAPLGADLVEKFFVTNAELIMPSRAA